MVRRNRGRRSRCEHRGRRGRCEPRGRCEQPRPQPEESLLEEKRQEWLGERADRQEMKICQGCGSHPIHHFYLHVADHFLDGHGVLAARTSKVSIAITGIKYYQVLKILIIRGSFFTVCHVALEIDIYLLVQQKKSNITTAGSERGLAEPLPYPNLLIATTRGSIGQLTPPSPTLSPKHQDLRLPEPRGIRQRPTAPEESSRC